MSSLTFLELNGAEGRKFAREIASLRINVFRDFPYLYEGSQDYELQYLETYFKAKKSIVFIAFSGEKAVGVTTGVWAAEEEESFKKPFIEKAINPETVFYLGESVLLPEFRGLGIGRKFFSVREAYASRIGNIAMLSFASVLRSSDHPLKPKNYKTLNPFWRSLGYSPVPGMTTRYSWTDLGDRNESEKTLEFWMKSITQPD